MFSLVAHLKCTITVSTCCRGGFRRAFLSEGHGTAKRESSERHTTNPAMQFANCYALNFIYLDIVSFLYPLILGFLKYK